MSESQFVILVTSLCTLIAQLVALVLSHYRAVRQQYQLRRVGNTAAETRAEIENVDTTVKRATDSTAQLFVAINARLTSLESAVADLRFAGRDKPSS